MFGKKKKVEKIDDIINELEVIMELYGNDIDKIKRLGIRLEHMKKELNNLKEEI